MTIVGIDPGKTGGIAVHRSEGGWVAYPMPLSGKELDLVGLAQLLGGLAPDVVVMEKVHAMPGQGVTSMFTFGQGYGAIMGIVAALRLRLELVTPQAWKKLILAGSLKDKDAATAYVRRAFPSIDFVLPRCRTPHLGMVDAVCIAEYGVRTFDR